jgi:protein-S-isoprenylcysteine O-methyltransferase Ste14
MARYLIFSGIEIGVLIWIIRAIKSKVRHEITMSVGYFIFIILCFENFGHISGFPYQWVVSVFWLKVLGFAILGISVVLALTVFFTMIRLGKPKQGWEETTQLIDKGAFSLVRHPLYSSAFIASTGIFLTKISIFSAVIACISNILFFLSAFYEDKWDEEKFGDPYRRYQENTKLFIPFLY